MYKSDYTRDLEERKNHLILAQRDRSVALTSLTAVQLL